MRASSSSEPSAGERTRPHDARNDHAPREPASKVDVDRFRELFAATGREPPDKDATKDGALLPRIELDREPEREKMPRDSSSAEAALIAHEGRLAASAGAAAPSVSSPRLDPSAGLADLLEKHVRRLLVSENAQHGGRDARVVLSMGEGALAGTDLVLSRGERGWVLHADVVDEAQAETMERCAPDLIRRFAEQGLGPIDVEMERR